MYTNHISRHGRSRELLRSTCRRHGSTWKSIVEIVVPSHRSREAKSWSTAMVVGSPPIVASWTPGVMRSRKSSWHRWMAVRLLEARWQSSWVMRCQRLMLQHRRRRNAIIHSFQIIRLMSPIRSSCIPGIHHSTQIHTNWSTKH